MTPLASTTVDLARIQFATTTLYHFLFVPLTLGLARLVAACRDAGRRPARSIAFSRGGGSLPRARACARRRRRPPPGRGRRGVPSLRLSPRGRGANSPQPRLARAQASPRAQRLTGTRERRPWGRG